MKRYAVAALGCCFGGTLSVVLLALVIFLYAALVSQEAVTPFRPLLLGAFFAVYAGLLGLVEGLFLGLPLAAISGRLRAPG